MAAFSSLQEAREYFLNDAYAVHNGITLEALPEGGAVCAMDLTDITRNAEGGVMGGAILGLADFTFAAAASNAHRPTVAQQVSFSFLSASKGTRLISTAVCVKDGRSSCVYQISVRDDLNREIAVALFTGFKL